MNAVILFNKDGKEIHLEEDDFIVPDGFGIRCPTFLMDSVQREIASAATTSHRITDAFGNEAGHRPGYCFDADPDAGDTVATAREAYLDRLSNAWRSTPIAPLDTTSPLATDHHSHTPTPTRDAAALAYSKMVSNLQDAWKTPPATSDLSAPEHRPQRPESPYATSVPLPTGVQPRGPIRNPPLPNPSNPRSVSDAAYDRMVMQLSEAWRTPQASP